MQGVVLLATTPLAVEERYTHRGTKTFKRACGPHIGRKSREILTPDIHLLYVKSSGGKFNQFLAIMNPETTVVLKTLLIPIESDNSSVK